MVRFLFVEHFTLALQCALLFAAGLLLAAPIVRFRIRELTWLPVRVMGFVLRLMGPRPSIPRAALTIFLFNTVSMFAHMAAGYHPLLPQLLCVLTGMNIGIAAAMSGEVEKLKPNGLPQSPGWAPPPGLSCASTVLVLTLELPMFWYTLAMGISMGEEVQRGAVSYGASLMDRAAVYGSIVLPILLVSAAAEAIAIRGFGCGLRPRNPSR